MTYTVPSTAPAFIDDLAPDVALARATAATAREALDTANRDARAARDALAALSAVTYPVPGRGPVYTPRADVTTAAHDRARAKDASAAEAVRAATLAEKRAAENVRIVALDAVTRPDVIVAIDALAATTQAQVSAAWAEFRAALALRDVLDQVRRVRLLTPDAAGRLAQAVADGELDKVEYRNATEYGTGALIAAVAQIAAPSTVREGGTA